MTDLEKKVLEQIEKRGLVPRPYAYFLARRSVFWTLAVVSVVLGAISVAVIIYGALDYLVADRISADEIPFDDVFENLPFVWLAILVLFMVSALFGVHKTKRAYRYRVSGVVAGVVLISAILGASLQYFDVGRHVHQYLNAHVAAYERLVRSKEDRWSAPETGRLGGRVLAVGTARTLTLRDFRGKEWTVDFAAAKVTLSEPLLDEGIVAIRGVKTGPSAFRATAIEEWD
ncbi:MAG: hypothetical protein OEU46_16760 [Alphaproteobacteria bacterium]|nr:hypothetical protein [Alphaproteobacteria bacterium]